MKSNLQGLTIGNFKIRRPLGKENLGNMYLDQLKESHLTVTLKVLFRFQLVKIGMEHQLPREIEIQAHL